jgi:stage III sporulation protein AF
MSVLGEWLKQIVMMVVLAVLAEMLLPTKSMQKYVRLVMGLAIIAVMLQPVLPFFRRDWVDQMADKASREIVNGTLNESTAAPLQSVDRLKQDMQAQEDERANELVAAQLVSGVEDHFQCNIEDVVVEGVAKGPQSMSVHVSLTNGALGQIDDIRQWVSEDLGIALKQVVVKTETGG